MHKSIKINYIINYIFYLIDYNDALKHEEKKKIASEVNEEK